MQNNKWNLDRALDEYLKQTGASKSSASSNDKKRSKVVACFDVEQLDKDEKRHNRTSRDNDPGTSKSSDSKRTRRSSSPNQIVAVDQDDEESKYFKIMSWNIDGLDKGNVDSRAMGVVKTILRFKFMI